jgi:hypothetical protein
MSWITDAVQALKKIIIIEDRVSSMAEDLKKMAERLYEMDKRVLKLETKFEVYEGLSRKTLPRT